MKEKNVCPLCNKELKTRIILMGPVGWGRKVYKKKESFYPKGNNYMEGKIEKIVFPKKKGGIHCHH